LFFLRGNKNKGGRENTKGCQRFERRSEKGEKERKKTRQTKEHRKKGEGFGGTLIHRGVKETGAHSGYQKLQGNYTTNLKGWHEV